MTSLPRRKRMKPWIWVAVAVAVAVHAGVYLLLSLRFDTPASPPRRTAEVVVIPGTAATRDQVVRERLELLNPAPLIQPTRWNAGAQALPADLRRQPGEAFTLSAQERMIFATDRLVPVFDPPAIAPRTPQAALVRVGAGSAGWGSLGRIDHPAPQLTARDAGLEVAQLAGGRVVVRKGLNGLPELVRERDWEPLEFSVVVAAEGLIGIPSVKASSGVEAVDAFFRDYLVRTFRIGERLPPGFYRVVIVR